jgi:serine/threonine-protein kinase
LQQYFALEVVGMIGQLITGRFRIIKELGKGGFGETFLAEDTHNKINSECVVKKLITQADVALIPITQRLFYSEAKKLGELKNEGIPKLIGYFEDGGDFYLVQEFVDGHPLNHEINPSVKWTEDEVKDFLGEVLEILAYVHRQGSIHRDLKPENMMRRRVNKKLMLIDFGAVREVRQTPSNLAGVASGTVRIGTEGYMPAEQTQGKPCFASDVYAVGCIAIEALIGVSPCPNGFETDVKTGEIVWRHRAQVSDELAAIIDKMVRYHWISRYRDAGEVLVELEKLGALTQSPTPLPSSLSSPSPVSSTSQQPTKVVKSPTTKKKNNFGVIFVIIALTSGGAYLWQNKFFPFTQSPVVSADTSKESASKFFESGVKKVNEKNYLGAISDYQEAIKLNPDYNQAYQNLGYLQYSFGDKKGAIMSFKELARIYQKQGNNKELENILVFIKIIEMEK